MPSYISHFQPGIGQEVIKFWTAFRLKGLMLCSKQIAHLIFFYNSDTALLIVICAFYLAGKKQTNIMI